MLSRHDPLTGLYNRRYLDKILPNILSHSQCLGHRLGLIVMDVDHFKQFNERWGHADGDAALTALAWAV